MQQVRRAAEGVRSEWNRRSHALSKPTSPGRLEDTQMAGLNRTLAGRWALVTGGHVRVGRAISLELAAARMNVIVTYRTSPAAAEEAVAELVTQGVQAHALAVDLRDAAAVVRLAEEVLALTGSSLGLLVNSASVYPQTPIGEIS